MTIKRLGVISSGSWARASNPAPVMPLIEVVPALTTSDETANALSDFAVDYGKTPVRVRERAGFVVTPS